MRLRLFATALLAIFAACAGGLTNPDGSALTPTQQAVQSATTSYKMLDSAILSADAAVQSNTLKGQDARNALKGLTDAKAGLDVALVALRAANAAAAAAASAPASGAK